MDKLEPLPTLLEEYKECCASARHYSNIRFASLTIFFGLVGGCLTSLHSQDLARWHRVIIANMGIAITLVFTVVEAGVNRHINEFQERASHLERLLRFDSWNRVGNSRKVNWFHRTFIWLLLMVYGMFVFHLCMVVFSA